MPYCLASPHLAVLFVFMALRLPSMMTALLPLAAEAVMSPSRCAGSQYMQVWVHSLLDLQLCNAVKAVWNKLRLTGCR
jgi:hypothetical protein